MRITTEFAAIVFAICSGVVVLFQCALFFGAPWGEWTMGGQTPGRLPARLRVAAFFSAVLISGFAFVALSGGAIGGSAG